MARNLVSLFLLLAVAAVTIQGAAVSGKVPPKQPRGFVLLGSVKKEVPITINGAKSVELVDWNYWMSVNSAGYSDARKDCLANTDGLLQIETEEERLLVEEFLQDSDQSASVFWVGGKFQVSSQTFIWENEVPILDSLWGVNQPSQSKPNSRVAAVTAGQIVDLKAQAATFATRYLCEGQ